METIERVQEFVKNHSGGFVSHGERRLLEACELESFLTSLASERCVWKASDSPYYYWELSCHGGGSNDQANTSWEYCPYCGKRIEVKDE